MTGVQTCALPIWAVSWVWAWECELGSELQAGFGMAQGACPGSLCRWQQSRWPTLATILSPSYFRSSRAGPSVPSPEVLARFLYECRELPALRGPVCCLPGRGCRQKPPEELFQENIPAWKVLRGQHQLLAKDGAMETNPRTVRPQSSEIGRAHV